jgi:pSer/pThr/pTyr-binding forkhead associated (FHA) protein
MVLPRDPEGHTTTPLPSSVIDAIRCVRSVETDLALLVYHRDGVERVLLGPDAPVTIGRASPSRVCIRDDSLSREHARFTRHGRSVMVEDLGSLNGTWISGERVASAEVIHGDEVMLGNVRVCVRSLSEDGSGLPGVISHERFRIALEEEVVRARHFGRRCAVLMIRAARGRGAHVSRFYNRVRALLRPVDRIGLYSADVVAVLLVESSAEATLELAQAITATPPEGEEALLAGVAPFPGRGEHCGEDSRGLLGRAAPRDAGEPRAGGAARHVDERRPR